jgi:tRNA dimethylallyltransferase
MAKPKLIAIVGATGSGKSDLAVLLAKKYNGEIVSADSRQVYRHMDIGTGKITTEEMAGIPHHLLDIADPAEQYSVAQYQNDAYRAIADIHTRGKLPILVGGTGLYIQAVVDGVILPKVKPNPVLRAELEILSPAELFERLKKLDARRAATIDANNPRRLIRAIEIAAALGSVPPATANDQYDTLLIGIRVEKEELEQRIAKRFDGMLKKGLVEEIKNLNEVHGVHWERVRSFGLECAWVADFLAETISEQEMRDGAIRDTIAYAKRQMTWFKRDSRIHWIEKPEEAETLAQAFLS